MTTKENVVVLVRHGQSEWNRRNLFAGWKDVHLTQKGKQEARAAGRKLKAAGIHFDIAFTSQLARAWKTLILILDEMGMDERGHEEDLLTISTKALNERDYGDLTGLNKDEAREKWGEEQVHKWRRAFTERPPGGESLKDTQERVVPYFENHIMPHVKEGKSVIISAHVNSLRALIMHLDGMSEKEIEELNLPTATPVVYHVSKDGKLVRAEADLAA